MAIRYAHTNIIAADWQRLATFYQAVFDCVPVPPQRSQSGAWLEEGTGIKGAALEGMHMRLPGHGDSGPTLEIYSYRDMEEKPQPLPNRQGLGHLAFAVDDVVGKLAEVIAHGGRALGKVVTVKVAGAGIITFVYAADPEDNILELQKWE